MIFLISCTERNLRRQEGWCFIKTETYHEIKYKNPKKKNYEVIVSFEQV